MPKIALNKSSLNRQNARLRIFERYLPSLDLKRRQLIAERARALRALAVTRTALAAALESVGRDLPMLSNRAVDLDELVEVAEVQIAEENVLGVRLPTLGKVDVRVRDYSPMAKPHWVDTVVTRLQETLLLRLRLQVDEARAARMERAVQRITQRVNLFDKVLIPRTRASIRRIRIYLADAERSRVVQAKIAKRKRLGAAAP